MRYLLFVFLSIHSLSAQSQVINSLSKDKTGIYTHALDTCLSIIKQVQKVTKIYFVARSCPSAALPDTLQGTLIVKLDNDSKFKTKNLKVGEIITYISCIRIIRDEHQLTIMTHHTGDLFYTFLYYYRPETKDYYLKKIKRGQEM
jgi:hypothetical protein